MKHLWLHLIFRIFLLGALCGILQRVVLVYKFSLCRWKEINLFCGLHSAFVGRHCWGLLGMWKTNGRVQRQSRYLCFWIRVLSVVHFDVEFDGAFLVAQPLKLSEPFIAFLLYLQDKIKRIFQALRFLQKS